MKGKCVVVAAFVDTNSVWLVAENVQTVVESDDAVDVRCLFESLLKTNDSGRKR